MTQEGKAVSHKNERQYEAPADIGMRRYDKDRTELVCGNCKAPADKNSVGNPTHCKVCGKTTVLIAAEKLA